MTIFMPLDTSYPRSTTTQRGGNIEFQYKLWGDQGEFSGADKEESARLYAIDNTDSTYEGFVRLELQLEPLTYDAWQVTVRYGNSEEVQLDDVKWDYDTSGGSEKISQSLETIARCAPPGRTAPNYYGAIAVDDNGVQGTTVIVPALTLRARAKIERGRAVAAYVQQLALITGTINQTTWGPFGPAEVLFAGSQGRNVNETESELNFTFLCQPSSNDLDIDRIKNITKRGHDFLWVQYQEIEFKDEEDNAIAVVKRPSSVHIERVMRYANLEEVTQIQAFSGL